MLLASSSGLVKQSLLLPPAEHRGLELPNTARFMPTLVSSSLTRTRGSSEVPLYTLRSPPYKRTTRKQGTRHHP